MTPFTYFFLSALAVAAVAAAVGSEGGDSRDRARCTFYNASCVSEASDNASARSCFGTEICPDPHQVCYAVWSDDNTYGTSAEKLMGCIKHEKEEDCHQDECVGTSGPKGGHGHHFCCCVGDLCNKNYRPAPPEELKPSTPSPAPQPPPQDFTPLLVGIPVVVAVLIVALVVAICYVRSQRKSSAADLAVPGLGGGDIEAGLRDDRDLSSGPILTQDIKLIDVKGRGQFGAVYRAEMPDGQSVAVKLFFANDKALQSFRAERDVYLLPRLSHENILQFLGVKEVNRENYLVTKFHVAGSLHDFLRCNTVNWAEMCSIGLSIARGLAHLHEELPAAGTLDIKPAVAHRDFKSKNVLIRRDTTPVSACISDFGLALISEPSKPVGDMHGQVGTRRYMAPEVLDGAIEFKRESFLRIDMYACGLVLWELASRLQEDNLIAASEYKQPFDKHETNSQEGWAKFTKAVVDGERPSGPEKPCGQWRATGLPGMNELADTVEDCWDGTPDARVTASTVQERFRKMIKAGIGSSSSNQTISEEQRLNEANARRNEDIEELEMQPLINR